MQTLVIFGYVLFMLKDASYSDLRHQTAHELSQYNSSQRQSS